MSDLDSDIDRCVAEGPETALEEQLLSEFLRGKGYRMEDLHKLPPEKVTALMKEACQYASLKLAEIEAKSVFRKEIRPPV